MRYLSALLLVAAAFCQQSSQRPEGGPRDEGPLSSATFGGLKLRSVGPAISSGRVTSFAVDPATPSTYYVGVASGGVWKTTNGGVTYSPVFDNEGSYSIGHVTLDPRNPSTVWVGTGENNSQRSVSYGDGIYRSDDGGKSWRNMGLKQSEHIGRVLVDSHDSNIIFVAAQGPLWGPGGDRGLYKSTDGGKTWKTVLAGSEHTGATDVAQSPHNPDMMLAATWQRRRHVYTLINGGPESALYKSRDGGNTWSKVRGLPNEDLGRIGVTYSPAQKCLAYARVETANRQTTGIYRSTDCGESWERRGGLDSLPMYYGQIIADPLDPNRIFLGDTFARISEDGGRTIRPVGDRSKHVDTHTFWIDPKNTLHLLTGCDGGVYETWDRAQTWQFKANIPTLQFYDVTVDNALPNYHIYGGTQDNWSIGGPSRTRSVSGITNQDWFVTNGGDGFHSRVDPNDPNIVYATLQYGVLVRYDRRTGERVGIQPMEGKGDAPLRWNWDSPLMISPHSASRLYFAANKLFRSDDRGNSWRPVSGDLSRQLDRDKLPVMGRIQSADAVAKHQSTSFYGNITAISESPRKEGLLYAGTDDGLIQVSENAGGAWRKIETFPGVPEGTYVARLFASQHAEGTVYALFNNHKNADFKPYVLKSADKGATWTSLSAGLPENGPLWAIAEDPVNPDLLFLGTEYGLYTTLDGGKKWIRLRGGLPTIAVRDLAIQKREVDLVVATFGRGFYVLDDYSPLRAIKAGTLDQEAVLFSVKKSQIYVESQPIGGRGKSNQGESFYTAENPPFGAIVTYYLKDGYRTAKQQRQDAEKKAARENTTAPYPSKEQLVKEEEEEAPAILITITDAAGKTIRRLSGPAAKGIQRVAWNLRGPAPIVTAARRGDDGDDDEDRFVPTGPFVKPGTYKVSIAKRINGVVTPLAAAQTFQVDGPASIPSLADFLSEVSKLQRAVSGANENVATARAKMASILRALQESTADLKLRDEAHRIDRKLKEIQVALQGEAALARRNENLPVSINARIQRMAGNYRMSTGTPRKADQDQLQIAQADLRAQVDALKPILETDIKKLEKDLEAAGVPHTPGRLPELR